MYAVLVTRGETDLEANTGKLSVGVCTYPGIRMHWLPEMEGVYFFFAS
jgi:hypothetical protein